MGLKRIHLSRLPGLIVICAVLLAGYLLTDATAAPPPDAPLPDQIILEAKDNGRQVQLQDDQVLVITLDSNPSTGYGWYPEGLDETVLRQKGTSRTVSEPRPEWADRNMILRLFGIPHRKLTHLAEEGVVRKAKFGSSRQAATVYKVSDLESALCALASGHEPRRPSCGRRDHRRK